MNVTWSRARPDEKYFIHCFRQFVGMMEVFGFRRKFVHAPFADAAHQLMDGFRRIKTKSETLRREQAPAECFTFCFCMDSMLIPS